MGGWVVHDTTKRAPVVADRAFVALTYWFMPFLSWSLSFLGINAGLHFPAACLSPSTLSPINSTTHPKNQQLGFLGFLIQLSAKKRLFFINWKRKINYECHISNQAPLQRSGERRPPFSLRLWASLRCQVVSWITRISPGFGRFDTFMRRDIYRHNRNKSQYIPYLPYNLHSDAVSLSWDKIFGIF